MIHTLTDWVSGIYLYVSFNVTWTSLSVSQGSKNYKKSIWGIFLCTLLGDRILCAKMIALGILIIFQLKGNPLAKLFCLFFV